MIRIFCLGQILRLLPENEEKLDLMILQSLLTLAELQCRKKTQRSPSNMLVATGEVCPQYCPQEHI